MSEESSYKTAQSSVNRLKARSQYDYATIHSLIDSCPVLHVSINSPSGTDGSEPFPVILPMLGVTGSYESPDSDPSAGPRSIYLHGHAASRFMKAPGAPGAPSDGIPVCVAATFMDGLVLSYTPFHNSCNYRSAVAFGRAVNVTDEEERKYAMTIITDNMMPTRWENSRDPSHAEYLSTGILRVDIHSASAKFRVGTSSEERKDLKDEELRSKVWVGTIPVNATWGTPVPSPDNKVAKVPAYVDNFLKSQNKDAKQYAEDAIHMSNKKK